MPCLILSLGRVIGKREKVSLPDISAQPLWLPVTMMQAPLVKKLVAAGSIRSFITDTLKEDYTETNRLKVIDRFIRIRCRHDFPYWAATYIYIKPKGGGDDILFRLSRPQRKFVTRLEELRLAGKPIRLVLLKARQWGGSTTSQLYMAWLQLIHRTGLNSVIVSQVKKTSYAIKDMFDRALARYPLELLHNPGEAFNPNEAKIVNVGNSSDYKRIPQRNCKITIGTYEAPDAIRGDDYNLVHCSEVDYIPYSRQIARGHRKVGMLGCAQQTLHDDNLRVYGQRHRQFLPEGIRCRQGRKIAVLHPVHIVVRD